MKGISFDFKSSFLIRYIVYHYARLLWIIYLVLNKLNKIIVITLHVSNKPNRNVLLIRKTESMGLKNKWIGKLSVLHIHFI